MPLLNTGNWVLTGTGRIPSVIASHWKRIWAPNTRRLAFLINCGSKNSAIDTAIKLTWNEVTKPCRSVEGAEVRFDAFLTSALGGGGGE